MLSRFVYLSGEGGGGMLTILLRAHVGIGENAAVSSSITSHVAIAEPISSNMLLQANSAVLSSEFPLITTTTPLSGASGSGHWATHRRYSDYRTA